LLNEKQSATMPRISQRNYVNPNATTTLILLAEIVW